MTTLQSIIIAIVEGLTEFLPISSTAHMRITENLLGISNEDKFTKVFTVAIQLGAILSVVVLYFKKFVDFKNGQFYLKLIIAVIPALLFGKLFSEKIDELLEKPIFIACVMLAGGLFFLFADNLFRDPEIKDEKDVNYLTALRIGLFQCLAMIPGVSRSGASIIGGMSQKLSRTTAAEFSFFLAVPTMLGATIKKCYDYYKDGFVLSHEQINLLIIGNVVGFIVAMLAIKSFIGYLSKHGFKMFGYYRIIAGLATLIIHFWILKLTTI